MPEETNPGVSGVPGASERASDPAIRRAQLASLRRLAELRTAVLASNGEVPTDLPPDKLASMLTIETITTIVRAEIVLDQAADALIAYEQVLTRQLDERQAARENDTRWWRVLERGAAFAAGCLQGLGAYVAGVANDTRVRTALALGLASLVAAALGGLMAYFGMAPAVVTIPVGGTP